MAMSTFSSRWFQSYNLVLVQNAFLPPRRNENNCVFTFFCLIWTHFHKGSHEAFSIVGGKSTALPSVTIESDAPRRKAVKHSDQCERWRQDVRLRHKRAPGRLCCQNNGSRLQTLHGGKWLIWFECRRAHDRDGASLRDLKFTKMRVCRLNFVALLKPRNQSQQEQNCILSAWAHQPNDGKSGLWRAFWCVVARDLHGTYHPLTVVDWTKRTRQVRETFPKFSTLRRPLFRHPSILFVCPSLQIELATGNFPFSNWETIFKLLKHIVHDPSPTIPEHRFSPELVDFVDQWYASYPLLRVLRCSLLYSPSFQIELATGNFPYQKWETPFEQLKQVVMSDAPRLPEDRFSKEFTDFCSQWYEGLNHLLLLLSVSSQVALFCIENPVCTNKACVIFADVNAIK